MWPPAGLGIQENLDEQMSVIDGISDDGSPATGEKEAVEKTKIMDRDVESAE